MSTGPGRLQHRVVEVVEAAEERTMTRRQLEGVLVAEGYDRSNILRAITGLTNRKRVYLQEGRTLDEARVSVPELVRIFSDDEIFAMMVGL